MMRESESIVLLGVRISSTTKTRLELAVRKVGYDRSSRVSMAGLVDEILRVAHTGGPMSTTNTPSIPHELMMAAFADLNRMIEQQAQTIAQSGTQGQQ